MYDFVVKKKLHYILDSTILKLLADNNTNLITTVKYYLDYNENLNLIAEKLGISVKYISRIENGTGGVKVETLVNYMNILGITPNVIFEKLIVNKQLESQLQLSKKASKLSEEKIKGVYATPFLLSAL